MTPPTVLLLITTFDIGGAERVFIELARGLTSRGFRVLAVCLQWRSGAVAAELEESGVRTVDLGMRGRYDADVVRRLVLLMRREQVDVVYTFLMHSHLVGRLAARMARVRVVLSSQQVMAWEGTTAERLNALTARWCTRVVAVSRNVATYLIREVGIPREKVVTIYNCVDTSSFKCVPKMGAPATAPLIGSIARLNPEKDHSTLLKAFVLVRAQHPGARLILAGDGPERGRLEAEAIRLGLADAVEFLGHVPDVRRLHERLDVYAQSSHVEGLPVAVLEALGSCLPVVASRVGGTEEAVLDGVGGLLVPPRSPELFAQGILWILAHPVEARQMGQRAREHVVAVFSADAMVTATQKLVTGLLAAAAVDHA